jgi:MFS family permease
MALAESSVHVVVLFILYGAYYGLAAGSAKALIADLVAPSRRATAYGAYHGLLGFTNLPASVLAGVLWQGVGPWTGFGPRAPFVFGATLAAVAAILLAFLVSDESPGQEGPTS